jgi:hypothetical protein
MKSSEPPALATWLLEHIRFSNTDEALAGDLLEEFTQGRSGAWYWRQVLLAIVVGFGKEVRIHWILTIRATIIGLAVSTGASMLLHFLILALRKNGIIELDSVPRFVPWALTSFLSGTISGWLVAFLHPKNRGAMLLTFAGALLIWSSMGRGVIPGPQPLVNLLIDYVIVIAGVVAGVFISRVPKDGAPSRSSPSSLR